MGSARTPAQRAAAALPRRKSSEGPVGDTPGERLFALVLGIGTFVVMGVAILWVAFTAPFLGWPFVVGGLVAYLAVRAAWVRTTGSETGTFAVDAEGRVLTLSGHGSVRHMAKVFDRGVASYRHRSVVVGVLIGLLLPFGLAGVCVALDSPAPAAVFLVVAAFAMLDVVRWFAVVTWLGRQEGVERLDGPTMLPLMALYARHRGWRAAVGGVPADDLADELARHPAEVEVAAELSAFATRMARLGTAGGAMGGAASVGDL